MTACIWNFQLWT